MKNAQQNNRLNLIRGIVTSLAPFNVWYGVSLILDGPGSVDRMVRKNMQIFLEKVVRGHCIRGNSGSPECNSKYSTYKQILHLHRSYRFTVLQNNLLVYITFLWLESTWPLDLYNSRIGKTIYCVTLRLESLGSVCYFTIQSTVRNEICMVAIHHLSNVKKKNNMSLFRNLLLYNGRTN